MLQIHGTYMMDAAHLRGIGNANKLPTSRRTDRIKVMCLQAMADAEGVIDKANDPRVTAILRWSAGICAPIIVASGLSIIGLLLNLRDSNAKQAQQITDLSRAIVSINTTNVNQDNISNKFREDIADIKARVRYLEARGGFR